MDDYPNALPPGWTRAVWTLVMLRIARKLCARCGHDMTYTHTQTREEHDGLVAEVAVRCVACKCNWAFNFLGGGRVIYDDEPDAVVLNPGDVMTPISGG